MKEFIKDTLMALLIIPYLASLAVLFLAAAAIFIPVIFILEKLE